MAGLIGWGGGGALAEQATSRATYKLVHLGQPGCCHAVLFHRPMRRPQRLVKRSTLARTFMVQCCYSTDGSSSFWKETLASVLSCAFVVALLNYTLEFFWAELSPSLTLFRNRNRPRIPSGA